MNPLKKLLLSPESLKNEKTKEKKEKAKAEKEKALQLKEKQEKELMEAAKERSAHQEEMNNRKDRIFSKATIELEEAEPLVARTFLVKGLHTWEDFKLDSMVATLSYHNENTGLDANLGTRSVIGEEISIEFKMGEIPFGGLPMKFKIEIVDDSALPLSWPDGSSHFNTFVRVGKFPNSDTTKVILDLGKDPEYQEWIEDLKKTEEFLLKCQKMYTPYMSTSGVTCSAPLVSSAIGVGDIFTSSIASAGVDSFRSQERYLAGLQAAPPRERTRK